MLFCHSADQREAQPGALVAPVERAFDLDEGLEDPLEILGGDADAAVPDADAEL